jgi:hypothetical protein
MRDELVDGDVLRLDLAERRQHLRDVREERPVGPHDEHAAAPQPVTVGVEQVRGAVQADGGLAGPWRALNADRLDDVGAHDLVLLRLDGRDDVAHRSGARTLDLGLQDAAAQVVLRRVDEMLVLVRGEGAGLEAEPAAQRHAHRVRTARR